MESATQARGLRVREGRTELEADHLGRTITFLHPAYGPDDYFSVQRGIEKAGLRVPTMAETISLAYSAWQNPNEKYSKEIIQLLKNGWFWGFTGNLYVPNKGVYIQDNPEVKSGIVIMNEQDLVKKLESGDDSVRFVPFGFQNGEISLRELEKNPYVQALVGEEGAEKLGEVTDKYRKKLYLYSFKNVNEPIARVPALSSDWNDLRLNVSGYSGDGYAFGLVGLEERGIK